MDSGRKGTCECVRVRVREGKRAAMKRFLECYACGRRDEHLLSTSLFACPPHFPLSSPVVVGRPVLVPHDFLLALPAHVFILQLLLEAPGRSEGRCEASG